MKRSHGSRVRILGMVILVILLCSAGPAFAGTKEVKLNSGAKRTSSFISVDTAFKSADGKQLRLVMSGLKEGNRKQVLASLCNHYSTASRESIRLVDDAFCDAEKWDKTATDDGYDANHCWAAACANMLWISGWTDGMTDPRTDKKFTSEDEIFSYYNSRFTSYGADADRGLDWMFMGQFYADDRTRHASLKGGGKASDGRKKSFVSTLVQRKYDLVRDPSQIRQLIRIGGPLKDGAGKDSDEKDLPVSSRQAVFQGSIGDLSGGALKSSIHSVTIVGIITDPDAAHIEDRYQAIILADGDNDGIPSGEEKTRAASIKDPAELLKYRDERKTRRPNSYTVCRLSYKKDRVGNPYWAILGYFDDSDDDMAIYDICALPLPEKELISANTEKEGSKDLMRHVDLTVDHAVTLGVEQADDPKAGEKRDGGEWSFSPGEPIYLKYFIANKSYTDFDSGYADDTEIPVHWEVISDRTREKVASGTRKHSFRISAGGQAADQFTLNAKAGRTLSWKAGNYTVRLRLNGSSDGKRAVREAYYRNNGVKDLHFTVR